MGSCQVKIISYISFNMATEESADVVIVGAGISGLTAAYLLKTKDSNLRVIVLEAKDRVGGRTQTVPLKSARGSDYWDLGGQWVGRCQPHIMTLLKELGLETYPQYLRGIKFMQLGDNKVRFYTSDIPSLSVFALLDLHRFMTKLEKMRKTVSVEDPWKCRDAREWDQKTLTTYMKEELWTKGAWETIDSACRCAFGVETTQMSLLFFLTYLSAADGLRNLCEATDFTAQEYKIKGGAQQVSKKLLEKVGFDNVWLQEAVSQISQEEDSVTVTTTSGKQLQCERVIFAVPPPALGKIRFEPPLPHPKQELIRRMTFSTMIKVIITYEQAFWQLQGQSGEAVSNGGPSTMPNCDSGPVCITYDASSSTGSPALVAFLGGRQAVQWAQQTAKDRRAAVLTQLASYFGPKVYAYLEYVEKDWNVEPYTDGGPICTVGPGSMEYFQQGLRQPFDKLHFAGTETATVWCGYMNGAVQAGYRAAIEVLQYLRPQVLTRADYSRVTSKGDGAAYAFDDGLKWVKWMIGLSGMSVIGFILARRMKAFSWLAE